MSENLLPQNINGVHIHFVGIKGTGMAALVEILFSRGAIITGSDVPEVFYTDEILNRLHLKALPFSKENITDKIEYVIYSSAYSLEKNPDLIAAKEKGVPCMLYTQALGCVSEAAYSCAVCGVHGKTTTTGLCGTIMQELNLPSQILAGSIISSFGNTCTLTTPSFEKTQQHIFIAETCEYQRHFMSFCPQKIILTSVESDHQDYYPTYEDILNAFVDFICRLPKGGTLIYCADDKGAVEAATKAFEKRPDIKKIAYGENAPSSEYKLTIGNVENERRFFEVSGVGKFEIDMPGIHLVRNSNAAIALASELLKDFGKDVNEYYERMAVGLKRFRGGKRRSEIIGKAKNSLGKSILFMDDYGHHPTAIKTTLAGYKEFYPNRKLIVDFMSHTYSRTQSLLEEFASSFDSADLVILHKVYASARENIADAKITDETLFEHTKKYHKNVFYYKEILDAKDFAISCLEEKLEDKYSDGYLFVTMGAGDNWKIGDALLKHFSNGDK